MRNIIDSYKITIAAGQGPFIKQLRDNIAVTDRWYSWSLYKKDRDNYTLTYHVSQTARYNIIDVGCAVTNIVTAAATNTASRGIVGYEQPSLSILVEVMAPLVNSLVNRQASRWRQFSHDDLTQTCYMCLCELYRKGYYIHKALLQRTFTNTLYYKLRKVPRDVTMVSLSAPVHDTDDIVQVQDCIPDEAELVEEEERENNAVVAQILAEQRAIIVELIGQRRYDELLREWRSKTVTNKSSATVNRLRKMLLDAGYKPEQWNKYFE